MNKEFKIIINEYSSIPKFKQVVNCITNDVTQGRLKLGEKIPSINGLSEMCYISRDTVMKAYQILGDRKIITSVKGKGYYVHKADMQNKLNIFFMINKPSTYKISIYQSFVSKIKLFANVEMCLYHCDQTLFINALENSIGAYDYYIIIPHFRDGNSTYVGHTDAVIRMIKQIPADKLILLDNTIPDLNRLYGAVFQDFKYDIYHALKEAINKIMKYEKLFLVYPKKSQNPYPGSIVQGFKFFCSYFNFKYEILDTIPDDIDFTQRNIFITIEEQDLVQLFRLIRNKQLVLGKEVGIISYNDSPLKELLGINVITTDFKAMGEATASIILNYHQNKFIKNTFRYIERSSL